MWADRQFGLNPRAVQQRRESNSVDPVIIIGAPRSGTNMLRDVLAKLPDATTWPCDEINPVWRHGNRDFPSDELDPELATAGVKSYLRAQFDKMGKRYGAHTVVEKTCANSLRVPFVARVFPEARYIFIHRDGVDAASSAMNRWNAAFNLQYTVKKARFIPPADLIYYANRFIAAGVQARFDRPVLASAPVPNVGTWWGPKPWDYEALRAHHPLDEVCVLQWQRCVEASLMDLSRLGRGQVLDVAYEQFVKAPAVQMRRILTFLGRSDVLADAFVRDISQASIGKGKVMLGAESTARLRGLANGTLAKLGYA